MQQSMSLTYEPSSEPLHISVKKLFLRPQFAPSCPQFGIYQGCTEREADRERERERESERERERETERVRERETDKEPERETERNREKVTDRPKARREKERERRASSSEAEGSLYVHRALDHSSLASTIAIQPKPQPFILSGSG